MTERAILREVAKALRHPWQRLADGRELIVMSLRAGDAEVAAGVLLDAARVREMGPALVEPRR